MKRFILISSLVLLGSVAAKAQSATNEPVAMTFSVQFNWSTNQTIALKACWREAIIGVTNPPTFAAWATEKIKAAMAATAAKWEAQRVDREQLAKSALIARLAACEPSTAQWLTISNQIVAAEAAQR